MANIADMRRPWDLCRRFDMRPASRMRFAPTAPIAMMLMSMPIAYIATDLPNMRPSYFAWLRSIRDCSPCRGACMNKSRPPSRFARCC